MAETARRLDLKIQAVVREGNCAGCGACCLLDDGLSMALDSDGYLRPSGSATSAGPASTAQFDSICPGRTVRAAPKLTNAIRHPTMGPALGVWVAWATDPDVRFRGSSGGAITALGQWLLAERGMTTLIAARRTAHDPALTESVRLTQALDVVDSAGSRYAPTANASLADPGASDEVFVGKPCEVAAVRAMAKSGEQPLLVSFFCAGTPSQHATEALIARLGNGRQPKDLWYRGRGWPGRFTVINDDDTVETLTYDESWGKTLGPTTQWRCKICPDGVGESADIVASDYWEVDARGYPVFDDGPGASALIARTPRGLETIQRAVAAGVIAITPTTLERLAMAQPFQVKRRSTLAARLLGARLAGRQVPKYRGFGLLRLAAGRPVEAVRTVRGSFRRVREARRARLQSTS